MQNEINLVKFCFKKNSKVSISLAFLLFFSISLKGQKFYFEVVFSDKFNSKFTKEDPIKFLSEKSILRRRKQNILITEQDIPVNQNYVNAVKNILTIESTSKWFNLITVSSSDSAKIELIKNLPFVKTVKFIGKKKSNEFAKIQKNKWLNNINIDSIDYGNSALGIKQMNGDYLHSKDYLGENMTIAILDAGFSKVDNMTIFENLFIENKILSTKNFVTPNTSVYSSSSHGTMVLSILAGQEIGNIFGSAPKSNYLLLLTEDVGQENLIEEYYWASAAEYADSAGADVINSSLGYYEFDSPEFNHTISELNSNSTMITMAANTAFEKGILVFNSAGNEGDSPWEYIIFPADGKNVIAVGAVNLYKERASFSSIGYDFPNQIKPNLAALGSGIYVQSSNSNGTNSNGTSFSSPLLCGLSTCFWQAFPDKSNQEIKDLIQECANQYSNPDEFLGYGIPDFKKAFVTELEKQNPSPKINFSIYPNPLVGNNLYIQFANINYSLKELKLYASDGNLVLSKTMGEQDKISDQTVELSNLVLSKGIYFIELKTNNGIFFDKVLKL